MQTSPSTSVSIAAPAGSAEIGGAREERVYQAVTIAAILLVLGSLWIF